MNMMLSTQSLIENRPSAAAPRSVPPGVALVSGGSRGIGRAVVLALARSGYDVAFCFQSSHAQAAGVERAAAEAGGHAQGEACDVADAHAVSRWVGDVEQRIGAIELVVNVAGITRDHAMVTMDPADWDRVIDVNLTGTFNICRVAAFGMLRRRRGCIINMSSVCGVYGNAGQANYAASKAGIIGLSSSIAKELGPHGIRVNVVAPGLIETDMTARLGEKRLAGMVGGIPLRRIGQAEEVAATVAFLASPQASYISGQVIGVDGGLVL
jgi:3-oxoacyl-[acyl-carrier protein] reductase